MNENEAEVARRVVNGAFAELSHVVEQAVNGGPGSYEHPISEQEHEELCSETDINIYDGEQAECDTCRLWYELPWQDGDESEVPA